MSIVKKRAEGLLLESLDGFASLSYYKEATALIKGYKPIENKLGKPLVIKKVQLEDKFNFVDPINEKVARVSFSFFNVI